MPDHFLRHLEHSTRRPVDGQSEDAAEQNVAGRPRFKTRLYLLAIGRAVLADEFNLIFRRDERSTLRGQRDFLRRNSFVDQLLLMILDGKISWTEFVVDRQRIVLVPHNRRTSHTRHRPSQQKPTKQPSKHKPDPYTMTNFLLNRC